MEISGLAFLSFVIASFARRVCCCLELGSSNVILLIAAYASVNIVTLPSLGVTNRVIPYEGTVTSTDPAHLVGCTRVPSPTVSYVLGTGVTANDGRDI